MFNWRELGMLLAKAVVVHHEELVALHKLFMDDMLCPAEKATSVTAGTN